MMTTLDVSRAPRGVLAAQLLVAAVAEHGDMAERHYLELKSALNLSAKRDKEKIAKFILGAANRMPDVAAAAFEGYGVMIIGVSQGAVEGIPPVEMMELSKVVQQYVGVTGPRWDVMWVPVEGSDNQVLLVLVDPPQPGQAPFPCRANGDSLSSGRIYIRADGETREANADEFDLLVERGSAQAAVAVDFGLEILGEISMVSVDQDRTIEAYLTQTRNQLLAALPAKEPPATAGLKGVGGASSLLETYASAFQLATNYGPLHVPEERTEEEYRASIERWEEHFRNSWAAATSKIAVSQLTPIVVKLINRTTTFFHDVAVKLHLEGEVLAFEYVDPRWADDFPDLELPHPPRKWGPYQRDLGLHRYGNLIPGIPSGAFVPPSVSFKNGGSVDLDLDVGDLRPLGIYESEEDEFVLIVADATMTSVRGTWQLTARDHNQVYTGEITVPVAGDCDITESARHILMLKNEGQES